MRLTELMLLQVPAFIGGRIGPASLTEIAVNDLEYGSKTFIAFQQAMSLEWILERICLASSK